jgi:hypothetical protein
MSLRKFRSGRAKLTVHAQWMIYVVSAIRVENVSGSRPRIGSARSPARHKIFGEAMGWAKQRFLKAKPRRWEAV